MVLWVYAPYKPRRWRDRILHCRFPLIFFREDKEREGNRKKEMESGSLILSINFKVDVGPSKNIVKY